MKNLAGIRGLALLLLAGVAVLGALEAASPLARALRQKTPWLAWISFADGSAPALSIYHPGKHTLDILYLPETAKKKNLSAALPAPIPSLVLGQALAAEEPPTALKNWIAANSRGPGSWKKIPAWLRARNSLPVFDRLLLALEIHRLPARRIRPAWLPEDSFVSVLLARLMGPAAAFEESEERPITAEVLNATGQKGVASQATKVLRLKGVDVVYSGNAELRIKTALYDRTGTIETAARIAESLGCPDAEVLTQVNFKKMGDVTVMLAPDCPLAEGDIMRRKLWNSLKF